MKGGRPLDSWYSFLTSPSPRADSCAADEGEGKIFVHRIMGSILRGHGGVLSDATNRSDATNSSEHNASNGAVPEHKITHNGSVPEHNGAMPEHNEGVPEVCRRKRPREEAGNDAYVGGCSPCAPPMQSAAKRRCLASRAAAARAASALQHETCTMQHETSTMGSPRDAAGDWSQAVGPAFMIKCRCGAGECVLACSSTAMHPGCRLYVCCRRDQGGCDTAEFLDHSRACGCEEL